MLKHFTAHDVVSRYNVVELKSRATARTASLALEALRARLPFAVKAVQIDGGSEFMADFELACQAHGIALFVLPPRSPKLNGGVERANRVPSGRHTEEFYECTSADRAPSGCIAALGADLGQWERIYNTVRPHQALGYLTPQQFVDRWQRALPQQEVTCG